LFVCTLPYSTAVYLTRHSSATITVTCPYSSVLCCHIYCTYSATTTTTTVLFHPSSFVVVCTSPYSTVVYHTHSATTTVLFRTLLSFTVLVALQQQYSSVRYNDTMYFTVGYRTLSATTTCACLHSTVVHCTHSATPTQVQTRSCVEPEIQALRGLVVGGRCPQRILRGARLGGVGADGKREGMTTVTSTAVVPAMTLSGVCLIGSFGCVTNCGQTGNP
jgi:hypothetical protein